MQWRMLRRRGGSASWTIVGDPAQSSWPDLDEYEHALTELVGTAPVRRFRMSTNYRSPAEVFNLAAQVVRADYPQADLPHAVRSTGVDPELTVADPEHLRAAIAQKINQVNDEVDGTIGLIAPQSVLNQLGGIADLVHPGAREKLAAVTPLQSKGLEYDAVIVIGPDEIVAETAGGVRVLYVALTRATQRLVVVDLGESGKWRAALTEESEG